MTGLKNDTKFQVVSLLPDVPYTILITLGLGKFDLLLNIFSKDQLVAIGPWVALGLIAFLSVTIVVCCLNII